MIPKVKKIKMGTLTGGKIKTEDGKVERMECQQNTSDACNWLARQWCLRYTGSVACNLHKLFFSADPFTISKDRSQPFYRN
jgi:hypothetical protein